LPPDFSSQAESTKGSFTAMQATVSMPCCLNSAALSMKPGKCFRWQVGVKAPGTANITTFLPPNTSPVVNVLIPSAPMTLNVASGRRSPTAMVIDTLLATPIPAGP
jgi:hypothetical protein